jgi:hypothetical protein
MTSVQEVFIISKFEHARDLMNLILSQADERLLCEIMGNLSAMEVDIWLEQDRRAGKPWALRDREADNLFSANTAKFAF